MMTDPIEDRIRELTEKVGMLKALKDAHIMPPDERGMSLVPITDGKHITPDEIFRQVGAMKILREIDRMLTTDPETYEAEQKLRTMAHAAMQVEDNWASSEDYDRQRENERLDAMASLIVEARGYDIHGRKK